MVLDSAKVDVYTLSTGQIAIGQHKWLTRIALSEGRYDLRLHASCDQPVANNRNRIVREFLQGDGDYLMMVDEDQAADFNPLDLVAYDKDILGFPTPVWKAGESSDEQPVRMNITLDDPDGGASGAAIRTEGVLMELAGSIGSGMIIIARRVLEHPEMRAPFQDAWDQDGIRRQSEDWTFCRRARAAGFSVWIAPNHPSSHYKCVDLLRVYRALESTRRISVGRYVPPADALRGKRLIFSLSAGRCGTAWLAKALNSLDGVDARHEPRPEFRHVLRAAQRSRSVAVQFWLSQKIPALVAQRSSTYVETSHLFVQGFAEALLEIGLLADLIVIRRSHRETALSMWRRKAIPGRNKLFSSYHVQPDDPDVRVRTGSDWHTWSDYQVCYWYCLEVEARTAATIPSFRKLGAKIHETTMRQMVTREGLDALTDGLGLQRVRDLPARVNANAPARSRRMPPADLEAEEDLFVAGSRSLAASARRSTVPRSPT